MKNLVFILVFCCSINGFTKTRYIDLTEELDSASFVGELVFIGYDSITVEKNPHAGPIPGDSIYNIHYAYFIDGNTGDTVKYKPMDHWHNWNYYKERPDEFTEILKSNGYWPRLNDTCLVVVNKNERISLFAKLEKGNYIFWDPYHNNSWTTYISFDGPFECLEQYESDWNKRSSKRLADRTKRENGCAFHVTISKKLFWDEVMNIEQEESSFIPENNLVGFNKFLGLYKSNALNQLVESFEIFLEVNYSELQEQERTEAFLRHLQSSYSSGEVYSGWKFSTQNNKKVLDSLESSGMRLEIENFGYEEYKCEHNIYDLLPTEVIDTNVEEGELIIEEIGVDDSVRSLEGDTSRAKELIRMQLEIRNRLDSSLTFNIEGKYLYGLAKYNNGDSLIQEYVEARLSVGDIMPDLSVNEYLKREVDYENPLIKRMVVVDFYLDLIRWDVESKTK